MSKYQCPACSGGFDKPKEGICPHCGMELEAKRVTTKGVRGFKYIYIIKDPNSESTKKILSELNTEKVKAVAKEEKKGDEWILEGHNSDIPVIYKLENSQPPRYRVEYHGIIYTGWLYCPNCWAKMRQNIIMNSGWLEQEDKCRCGAIIQFVFDGGQNVSW